MLNHIINVFSLTTPLSCFSIPYFLFYFFYICEREDDEGINVARQKSSLYGCMSMSMNDEIRMGPRTEP